MKQVPKSAKRVPADVLATGFIDLKAGKKYSWTTVKGTATKRTQTEVGMGKVQTHYEVSFECPRCEEPHRIHSDKEHGTHYVRCHCDATLVFTVTW